MSKLRVSVIEDDSTKRATNCDLLKDADLDPIPLAGPFQTLDALVAQVKDQSGAALCDHQLHQGGFANFTGAMAVSKLNQSKTPAVLVTKYRLADVEVFQALRRHIPVLLSPADAAKPEVLLKAFDQAIYETSGKVLPGRATLRTLIRVEEREGDREQDYVKAVIPAWKEDDGIRIPLVRFPPEIRAQVKEGFRFFGQVNLGAASVLDLIVDKFEFPKVK